MITIDIKVYENQSVARFMADVSKALVQDNLVEIVSGEFKLLCGVVSSKNGRRLQTHLDQVRKQDRENFESFYKSLREETQHNSKMRDTYDNPNYKGIISIGPVTIPWIIEKLTTEGGFWHQAMCTLTGVNPFRGQGAVSAAQTKSAWLDWWKRNQYLRMERVDPSATEQIFKSGLFKFEFEE